MLVLVDFGEDADALGGGDVGGPWVRRVDWCGVWRVRIGCHCCVVFEVWGASKSSLEVEVTSSFELWVKIL